MAESIQFISEFKKKNRLHRPRSLRVRYIMSSFPLSGKTKYYEIGVSCFSAQYQAIRSESRVWLDRNQDSLSVWSDMSIRELLFQ